MKVAVKDANILIDLIEADLLGHWFGLGIETHTTDLVRFEIRRPAQRELLDRFVEAGMLRVEVLEADGLDVVSRCAREHRVSLADASALLLAQRLGAALLSGDAALRTATKSAGVEVRGLIWVFRMVERAVLSKAQAAVKLKRLLEGESFLPQTVCRERIRAWEAAVGNG